MVLPPLRERREDIPLIAQAFLRRYAEQHKCVVPELTPAVLEGLKGHDWPGNVRELENALERLIVMAEGGPVTVEHLRFTRPQYVLRSARGNGGGAGGDVPSLIRALVQAGLHAPRPDGLKLHRFLVDGLERELIEAVMRAGTKPDTYDVVHGLGSDDNPVFPDMHHASAHIVGASVEAFRQVWSGESLHAVNITGGSW